MSEPLLSVRDLRVAYRVGDGDLFAVDGASFDVPRGAIVGIVGESGCGKTTVARALTRIMAGNARIESGEAVFDGRDIFQLPEVEMNRLRWRDIAFIPQSAMNSLDPVYRVVSQLHEVLRQRGGMTRRAAVARAEELFEMVGIEPGRLRDFPHQFSGGMRQRVMIAMALSCNPKLLLADEPTTALDVTIQAQILELLTRLTRELGTSVIIITHNLGVVARYADRVNVMYAGRIIESASAAELYPNPRHPYTLGLLRSVPRLDQAQKARLDPIEGMPPDLINLGAGCSFRPRCRFAVERCAEEVPPLTDVGPEHVAACWEWENVKKAAAAGADVDAA
jgi:peptide/nickel transport system ATP-binding protein